jgi:hypothetical protein
MRGNKIVTPKIDVQYLNKEISANDILLVMPKFRMVLGCEIKNNRLGFTQGNFSLPENEKAVIIFIDTKEEKYKYFFQSIMINKKPTTIKIDTFDKNINEIENQIK